MNTKKNNDNKNISNENIEKNIKNNTKKTTTTNKTNTTKKRNKNNETKNELINYIIDNRKTIILYASLFLFVLITIAIFNNKITELDQSVHTHILNMRNDTLTNTLIIITNISSAYSLIVISILLLAILKKKKIPLLICLNLILSYIINATAKLIFTRRRPTGINLIEESGFSYPSGHAMISMAYFGFIAYLIYKNSKNNITKTLLIITLMITILTIGFSRIYLGVHYLSDVIGGFLLSTVYLIIYIKNINLENK